MNKQSIIIAVLAAIIIVGGGYVFISQDNQSQATNIDEWKTVDTVSISERETKEVVDKNLPQVSESGLSDKEILGESVTNIEPLIRDNNLYLLIDGNEMLIAESSNMGDVGLGSIWYKKALVSPDKNYVVFNEEQLEFTRTKVYEISNGVTHEVTDGKNNIGLETDTLMWSPDGVLFGETYDEFTKVRKNYISTGYPWDVKSLN